jgi:hypothetical protein
MKKEPLGSFFIGGYMQKKLTRSGIASDEIKRRIRV